MSCFYMVSDKEEDSCHVCESSPPIRCRMKARGGGGGDDEDHRGGDEARFALGACRQNVQVFLKKSCSGE